MAAGWLVFHPLSLLLLQPRHAVQGKNLQQEQARFWCCELSGSHEIRILTSAAVQSGSLAVQNHLAGCDLRARAPCARTFAVLLAPCSLQLLWGASFQ